MPGPHIILTLKFIRQKDKFAVSGYSFEKILIAVLGVRFLVLPSAENKQDKYPVTFRLHGAITLSASRCKKDKEIYPEILQFALLHFIVIA